MSDPLAIGYELEWALYDYAKRPGPATADGALTALGMARAFGVPVSAPLPPLAEIIDGTEAHLKNTFPFWQGLVRSISVDYDEARRRGQYDTDFEEECILRVEEMTDVWACHLEVLAHAPMRDSFGDAVHAYEECLREQAEPLKKVIHGLPLLTTWASHLLPEYRPAPWWWRL
jgi:hypothetical protein